jgi:AcrR family transcriptional regulator
MPRRRDEAKALFRNAILEAAEHVFAQQGFHGARIQDIAEHARIAVGTVYNHFEQKEDVLRALLEERMEGLIDQLSPLPSDPDRFQDKLMARVTRMLRYVEQHRNFYVLALEHGLFARQSISAGNVLCRPVHHIERFRATLGALVEEGIAEGALRPMDLSRLMWFFGGLMRTFALNSLDAGVTNLEAEAPLIVDLFLNGAGARTAP